jgi:hypothetical protein
MTKMDQPPFLWFKYSKLLHDRLSQIAKGRAGSMALHHITPSNRGTKHLAA